MISFREQLRSLPINTRRAPPTKSIYESQRHNHGATKFPHLPSLKRELLISGEDGTSQPRHLHSYHETERPTRLGGQTIVRDRSMESCNGSELISDRHLEAHLDKLEDWDRQIKNINRRFREKMDQPKIKTGNRTLLEMQKVFERTIFNQEEINDMIKLPKPATGRNMQLSGRWQSALSHNESK